jgi:hypothetical protein
MFDAVLLLAAPTFLAWTTLGALVGAADRREGVTGRWRRAPALGLARCRPSPGSGGAHSGAMRLYATGRPRDLARAPPLAPTTTASSSGGARRAPRAAVRRARAARRASPSRALAPAARTLRGC